jgi:hypothetical protein
MVECGARTHGRETPKATAEHSDWGAESLQGCVRAFDSCTLFSARGFPPNLDSR